MGKIPANIYYILRWTRAGTREGCEWRCYLFISDLIFAISSSRGYLSRVLIGPVSCQAEAPDLPRACSTSQSHFICGAKLLAIFLRIIYLIISGWRIHLLVFPIFYFPFNLYVFLKYCLRTSPLPFFTPLPFHELENIS